MRLRPFRSHCCEAMKAAVEARDQRGFSIRLPNAVEKTSGDLWYSVPHIEFRAFDKGADARIRIDADVPVAIDARIGIRYCPWCGCDLEKLRGA